MFKVKDHKEASHTNQKSNFLTGSFSSKNDKNIPIKLWKYIGQTIPFLRQQYQSNFFSRFIAKNTNQNVNIKITQIYGKQKIKMHSYKTIIQKDMKWQGLAEDRNVYHQAPS